MQPKLIFLVSLPKGVAQSAWTSRVIGFGLLLSIWQLTCTHGHGKQSRRPGFGQTTQQDCILMAAHLCFLNTFAHAHVQQVNVWQYVKSCHNLYVCVLWLSYRKAMGCRYIYLCTSTVCRFLQRRVQQSKINHLLVIREGNFFPSKGRGDTGCDYSRALSMQLSMKK